MSRQDYMQCVKRTHADHLKESWCGKRLSGLEWAFQSLDHAAESGKNEDRLIVCYECLKQAVAALKNGHES